MNYRIGERVRVKSGTLSGRVGMIVRVTIQTDEAWVRIDGTDELEEFTFAKGDDRHRNVRLFLDDLEEKGSR